MADDTKRGMASDSRHVYGPRPVGALMPGLTRPTFRRRAPAAAQVMADWPAIVGPALAAVTTPRRLQSGILTLACAGPVAMELQHLADELLARINRHLGSQTVTRLRFVQDALPPIPQPAPPVPSEDTVFAAEKAVSAIPPGPLREALAALGRAVLTPRSPSTAARPRR